LSKYLISKFLYTIDRDLDLVELPGRPRGTVTWWEWSRPACPQHPGAERSTWLGSSATGGWPPDCVRLFELGAHSFLTLTLFIAVQAGLQERWPSA
jgi:hypothetical protein